MKTRIRFATPVPNSALSYDTDTSLDIVVEKFVLYPVIEVKGQTYNLIQVAAVLNDPEVDLMVTVSKAFSIIERSNMSPIA